MSTDPINLMDAAFPGLELPETSNQAGYRVLARKYRPQSFDTLIGQEALVRTLRNAIASGRIHHGYMLTGVRGVGKTTTARLIARALNYIGPDGKGEPTVGPTDDCPVCKAIAEGRHVDVIEMDAASNTGVDDMREVIDSARYAPTEARYKVYIIDEVHMLSKSAFNALLKTLEEPPPSVIFIFATTEIRKVPVTVLSRCMRFDLRRVPAEMLIDHFKGIAEQENVTVEPEAMALVARAADGSVRDGLSLLDQAIALGDGKTVTAEDVRGMLGLADRQLIFDLIEAIIEADAERAIATYGTLHNAGAEATTVIQDLLDLTHFITRCALVPTAAKGADVPEAEATRASALAGKLAMPALTRIWQILMAGLNEVQRAPQPHMAAEMVILRLCHAAGLPDPSHLIKKLKDSEGASGAASGASGAASGGSAPTSGGPSANQNSRHAAQVSPGMPTRPTPSVAATSGNAALSVVPQQPRPMPQTAAPRTAPQTAPQPAAQPAAAIALNSFEDALEVVRQQKELTLFAELKLDARVVNFEQGRIELQDEVGISPTQGYKLSQLLTEATGTPWVIELVNKAGAEPVREQEKQQEAAEIEELSRHPIVAAIRAAFPDVSMVIDNLNEPEIAGFSAGESFSSDISDDVPFDPEDPGFNDDDPEF